MLSLTCLHEDGLSDIAMQERRLILLVILTSRTEAAAELERFERKASAILSRHGGRIERAIRLVGEDLEATFREVHVVSFPDEASLASYRLDPELTALQELRGRAIVSTEIFRGHDVTY